MEAGGPPVERREISLEREVARLQAQLRHQLPPVKTQNPLEEAQPLPRIPSPSPSVAAQGAEKLEILMQMVKPQAGAIMYDKRNNLKLEVRELIDSLASMGNPSYGCWLNVPNEHGRTALHRAAVRGFCQFGYLLIQRGADINAADAGGKTPLHECACGGHARFVHMLFSVDRKRRRAFEQTWSATPHLDLDNHREQKRFLAKDSQKAKGTTALHRAIRNQHRLVIEELLRQQCAVNIPDDEGITSFQLLIQYEYEDLAGEILSSIVRPIDTDWGRPGQTWVSTGAGTTSRIRETISGSGEASNRRRAQQSRGVWTRGVVVEADYSRVIAPCGGTDLDILAPIYKNRRHELCQHKAIQALLSQKWERFAMRSYYQRVLINVAQLTLFMIVTYQSVAPFSALMGDGGGSSSGSVVFEWALVLITVYLLGQTIIETARDYLELSSQPGEESWRAWTWRLWVLVSDDPFQWASCIGLLVALPAHASNQAIGNCVLAFVSVFVCFRFFCDLRCVDHFGPLVRTMQVMSFHVIIFLTIYAIFLVGFSHAFYILAKLDAPEASSFDKPFDSLIAFFLITLGDFNYGDYQFQKMKWQPVGVFLFIVYIMVSTILLFNLLIAILTDDYTKVYSDAVAVSTIERIKVVVRTQRHLASGGDGRDYTIERLEVLERDIGQPLAFMANVHDDWDDEVEVEVRHASDEGIEGGRACSLGPAHGGYLHRPLE
jgi:hypothetical protein